MALFERDFHYEEIKQEWVMSHIWVILCDPFVLLLTVRQEWRQGRVRGHSNIGILVVSVGMSRTDVDVTQFLTSSKAQ